MADWYVSSVAYAAVTAWSASASIVTGDIRKQTAPTAGNERCFRAGGNGTTGGSEPTWTITKAGTTADNGITWTEVSGSSTYNTPTAMTAPHRYIENAISWSAGGDRVLFASDHVQNPFTTTSFTTLTLAGSNTSPSAVLCFDPAQSTLTEATGGQANIPGGGGNNRSVSLAGWGHVAGLTSNLQQGYSSGGIGGGTGRSSATNVSFYKTAGNGDRKHGIGQNQNNNLSTLRGVNFKSDHLGSSIDLMGNIDWDGGTLFDTGTVPTNIFRFSSYFAGATLRNINLSAAGSGKNLVTSGSAPHSIVLSDSKYGSGLTINPSSAGMKTPQVDIIRCSDGGAVYQNQRHSNGVSQITDTALAIASEATDGTTPISWKVVTPSTMFRYDPFMLLPYEQWQDTTGAGKTATIEGIINAAAVPTNIEVGYWLEYYASSSSNVMTQINVGGTSLEAGTNRTASTKAWDAGAVAARANSTVYSLGATIKLASNPGRIFFCTTAGTSAGSEPAGYATAIDGGSVTDNTAVFRAGCRFKMTSASWTPQQKGPIRAQLYISKASVTLYLSPFITVA